MRQIKLQIVKEGHCREKRSKRPSIKRHGDACIRSWYQWAKESHCNPWYMLWLISFDSHAYSENLVASRASFMILLLQSAPCWNFNHKSHFSVFNYLWVNTLSPRVLKSSYSDWSKCSDHFWVTKTGYQLSMKSPLSQATLNWTKEFFESLAYILH